MSIRVFIEDNKLLIEYSPDNGVKWIDEIIKTDEEFTLKKTFTFCLSPLINWTNL